MVVIFAQPKQLFHILSKRNLFRGSDLVQLKQATHVEILRHSQINGNSL